MYDGLQIGKYPVEYKKRSGKKDKFVEYAENETNVVDVVGWRQIYLACRIWFMVVSVVISPALLRSIFIHGFDFTRPPAPPRPKRTSKFWSRSLLIATTLSNNSRKQAGMRWPGSLT